MPSEKCISTHPAVKLVQLQKVKLDGFRNNSSQLSLDAPAGQFRDKTNTVKVYNKCCSTALDASKMLRA